MPGRFWKPLLGKTALLPEQKPLVTNRARSVNRKTFCVVTLIKLLVDVPKAFQGFLIRFRFCSRFTPAGRRFDPSPVSIRPKDVYVVAAVDYDAWVRVAAV